MSGVEILSIIEEPICQFNGSAFGIGLSIIFTIGFICGICVIVKDDDYSTGVISVVLGIILGLIFGFQCGVIFKTETGEVDTTYKVTISEEVSLNDFMEKYEIIDQEGKIYTVRERGE